MVVIEAVDERSPAARLGLQKGDRLVSLNRQEINDVLDYEFYANDSGLRIEYLRGDERRAVSLWHRADEPLGLRFSTYLMDEKRRCRNGCIFCFIDQNPRGLRESLYFKDDDERLSFLHGNYVTLTNLAPAQIDRKAAVALPFRRVGQLSGREQPPAAAEAARRRYPRRFKVFHAVVRIDHASVAVADVEGVADRTHRRGVQSVVDVPRVQQCVADVHLVLAA